MPDVYSRITEADEETSRQLGDAMELRFTDPQQQAMLSDYLGRIEWPEPARVVEIGCGTGAIARALAGRPGVAEVVGVEPSAHLLRLARQLADGTDNLTFVEGDGRDVPLPDASFDVAVTHTVLSHAPTPERVVAEMVRLVRPGGWVALFDGDYATMTVARSAADPLQTCVSAFAESFINDPWVTRSFRPVLSGLGLVDVTVEGHGFLRVDDSPYVQSIVTRGARALESSGVIGRELADALVNESGRRVSAGAFFGFISYTSAVARKPL
jgi:ubiquinone/menaquinone biosynthesis C-methylase UbiE